MKLRSYYLIIPFLFLILFNLFLVVNLKGEPQETDPEDEIISNELSTLFRSAQGVISDHQDLINDEGKGNKGFTGEYVLEETKKKYEAVTNHRLEFDAEDLHNYQAQMQRNLLDSIEEVVDRAQPLINEKGKGFKGFIPALFARQLAEVFNKKMPGIASIKITAPKRYLRNRLNMPDDWENRVMQDKFDMEEWPKGRSYSEQTVYRGRKAFRYLSPAYYSKSCLTCHGKPEGEVDITGGVKEGASLGELGGAVSIIIYQ